MAFLSFRSMCIRKCDGLLVRAGELCAIVRASYLSPFFPFVLGLELWQYLRRQLPGDRFVRARNSRLSLRLLRGGAFAVTLMLPSEGWAHGDGVLEGQVLPDAPATQQGNAATQRQGTSNSNGPLFPQTPVKTSETSADVLKREERQRILGVVPNFNTVESSAGVPRLSPGQKFHLMYKSSVDPFVFVADAFVAGLGQARNTNPGFGQGAEGYFKRFGASYLDTADGNLWGNAILPILFKEDPRYFRLGSGSFTHRFLYSAATTVWCKRDNGTWGPNYANVLGNFISGGISNAYYPASDRGVEQTFDGALTVTAEGVIGAEFVEFWPDISRHLFKKHHAAQ
jgi:hypothetical protein